MSHLLLLVLLVADGPAIQSCELAELDRSREILAEPERRVDPDLRPIRVPGYDALSGALWRGGANLPAALLTLGADPNATADNGDPILRYAMHCGHLGPVEDLLRGGADPKGRDSGGRTMLDDAVWRGRADFVKLLLSYGADPQGKGRSGQTPLDQARGAKRDDLVALLESPPKHPQRGRRVEPPTIHRRPTQVLGDSNYRAPDGTCLAYSADGRWLVVGDQRGTLRWLDATSGVTRDAIIAHEEKVLAVAAVPGTNRIVSCGEDRLVRVWDGESCRELLRLDESSATLAVSPDGRRLFTGAHLWTIESTRPLRLANEGQVFLDRGRAIDDARWSFFTPDGKHLVLHRERNGLWVWDVEQGGVRRVGRLDPMVLRQLTWADLELTPPAGRLSSELLAIATSPYSVVTAADATLVASEPTIRELASWYCPVTCSPDGAWLASANGSRVLVHDVERGARRPLAGHTSNVLAVAVSPRGDWIASGGNDEVARIWDRQSGREVAAVEASSYLYSLACSPDGRLLAIGDNNGLVTLWDRERRATESYRPGGRITALCFDRAGELLASVGSAVTIYDLQRRQVRASAAVGEGFQGPLAWLPDSRLLIGGTNTIHAGETFKVPTAWTLDGGELLPNQEMFSEQMGHVTFIEAVAVSPDGRLLAASSGGAIRLWDLKARQPVGRPLCGHTWGVIDLAFSADGKRLASASWDGRAIVWEIPAGKLLRILDADVGRVSGVAFAPDGALMTANWDGTVGVWGE